MIVFYIKERFAKTHPKRHLFEHNLDDNDDDDGDDNDDDCDDDVGDNDDDGDDVHLAASASALRCKSSLALGTALPAK